MRTQRHTDEPGSHIMACVAQLEERLTVTQEVTGSNPVARPSNRQDKTFM